MASGNVAGDICPAGWRLPTGGGRGTYGRYWSATPNGGAKAFRLGVASTNWVTPDGAWNKWDAFAVRCIVK